MTRASALVLPLRRALTAFFCLGLTVTASAASPLGLRSSVDKAIARMRPSLVRIHVVSTEYSEGRELKMQAVGSGAIMTEDGYLVTNHHVAGHAAHLVCTLWNREEVDAELVGTDALTDIAVLKLKPRQPRKFVAARFGNSAKLRVGDSVLAMGSPMALSQSVTLGIMSNLEMTMPRFYGPRSAFRLDGEDVGSLVRWFGHDAAIYGGNSGGPLVNLKGEIIGINEMQFGLSGAIPGNLAQEIARGLIAKGKITRSWLGLDVQPRFKNSPHQHGVVISGVIPNSPASRAGIRAGDWLLRLNDQATDVQYDEQMPDLMRLLTTLPIGHEARLVLLRDGNEMELAVTPVERGEREPPQREFREWGITGCDLSDLLARELKRESDKGVLVTSVRPGGPSGEAKPGLAPQDVIVEVGGNPVRNGRHLIEISRALLKGQTDPRPALVAFERGSRRYLTVIRLGMQELRDPGVEVKKAWLPVETQVISRDIAQQRGTPDLKGVYVTQVYPNTTAAEAGFKPGDFIIAVDGEKLRASAMEHQEEFATHLRQYDSGANVAFTVLRGQEQLQVTAKLETSPKPRREMRKYRDENFDFTAREIAFFDVAQERWEPGQRGALIEEVKPGGWAELGELRVDDVILQVDQRTVDGVESLRDILRKVAAEKKSFVILKVLRGIHTVFLELEPAWKL